MDASLIFRLLWCLLAATMGTVLLVFTVPFVDLIEHRYAEFRMSRLADKLAPRRFMLAFVRVMGVVCIGAAISVLVWSLTEI